MNITERTYLITGMTPVLGSQPSSADVRADYIASRAPTPELGESENGMIDNYEDKSLTVFMRAPEDRALCMMDYQFIGFLKEACAALAAENGLKQAGGKVGTYVFCEPRVIRFLRGDDPVSAPDRELSRPLRAQTMQGPRVALTASELMETPWAFTVKLKLIENSGTKLSKPVTWDTIESALDYGALKGIGQWRNGGYGRFTWERIS